MMTDNEVQNGKQYVYKDHTYTVLHCDDVETKDSDDANWHPAVIYCSSKDTSSTWFVRRLDDFQAKFKPV